MAAGDVTIHGDFTLPPGSQGALRIMWGTVILDGANPTPVALTNYMASQTASPVFGVISGAATTATGDDPNWYTCTVSGVTLNVYAWKNTATDNPTYTASTNNSAIVNWLAVGPHI